MDAQPCQVTSFVPSPSPASEPLNLNPWPKDLTLHSPIGAVSPCRPVATSVARASEVEVDTWQPRLEDVRAPRQPPSLAEMRQRHALGKELMKTFELGQAER